MRLAALLVLAACAVAASQDESNGNQDKQTENPDKQVEYVTGPNVGIVGPTVLGGKGQEVQPSGEELQSTDKEQRDVSSQYAGYHQTPARQENNGKERARETPYPKYSYGEGIKYIQRQEETEENEKGSNEKKNQVVQIGNVHRPTKITYYQNGGSYPQTVRSEQSYYDPQNQELSSAQLLARIRTHQLSQLLSRGPTEYKQAAAQNHGQEEGEVSQSQAEKTEETSSSDEGHSEDNEGQQAPPTNAAPAYIPQEYLQYHIAAAQDDLQSTLHSPGKHVLQLFSAQEGRGPEQPQLTPTVQSNLHLQPIQNGHQIQYIPTYYTSQLPGQKVLHPSLQRPTENRPVHPPPAPNIQNGHLPNPTTYHRAQLYPQFYSNFQPSHHPLSTFSNEPTQYHLLQQSNEASRRPQKIYFQSKPNTQPQFAQKPNPYSQQHGQQYFYRPNTPERLPQQQPEHLALVSQSPPKTTQHRQTHDKPPAALQPQERPQAQQSHERPQALQSHERPQALQSHERPQVLQSNERPQALQSHERPQAQQYHERPQALQSHERPQALQSHERPQALQSHERPQALQSHERPQPPQFHERPQALQPEQVYQTESIQATDYKLGQALQSRPYTIQTVQKLQYPLQIQTPTPFPVKVVPLQPQGQYPLTYQLPNDKGVAFRPTVYPVAAKFGQSSQTEAPQQSLSIVPTDVAKLYNVKIPSYIKALEDAGQSKPFGFAQMSYGQSPGSYSYSIFNKHS